MAKYHVAWLQSAHELGRCCKSVLCCTVLQEYVLTNELMPLYVLEWNGMEIVKESTKECISPLTF